MSKRLKRYDSPSPSRPTDDRSHSRRGSRISSSQKSKVYKRGDNSLVSPLSHASEELDKKYDRRNSSRSSWSRSSHGRSQSDSRSPSPGSTLRRRSLHRLPVSYDSPELSRPTVFKDHQKKDRFSIHADEVCFNGQASI